MNVTLKNSMYAVQTQLLWKVKGKDERSMMSWSRTWTNTLWLPIEIWIVKNQTSERLLVIENWMTQQSLENDANNREKGYKPFKKYSEMKLLWSSYVCPLQKYPGNGRKEKRTLHIGQLCGLHERMVG